MKSWYSIKAQAAGSDEAEILIYDDIGMWGITAKQFVADVKASGAKKLHVRINSAGGEVFDGLAIYNFLRAYEPTVTIDGLAASISSLIAMAGKTVRMAENAFLMIHNPWGVVMGDSNEMRDLATVLDKLRDQIVATYEKRTKKDTAQIKQWMDATTYFNFEEAKANGFVDEAAAAPATPVNFAAFNLSRFGIVPLAIATPKTPRPEPPKSMDPIKAPTREEILADMKRFTDAYGADGATYFAEGKTFEQAGLLHKDATIAAHATEISTLKADKAKLEKRIKDAKLGEETPLPADPKGNQPAEKTILEQIKAERDPIKRGKLYATWEKEQLAGRN